MVSSVGLQKKACSRDLLSCIRILRAGGLECDAEYARHVAFDSLVLPAILFIPPSLESRVGHVVLLSDRVNSEVVVRDGPDLELQTLVEVAFLSGWNDAIVISRKDALISRVSAILIAMTCITALLVVLGKRCLRVVCHSNLIRISLSVILAIPVLAMSGCSTSSDDLGSMIFLRHDFGIVKTTPEVDYVICKFEIANSSDQEISFLSSSKTCGCVTTREDLKDVKLAPKHSISIPIRIGIDNRVGFFSESMLLRFRGTSREHTFHLTSKGFVHRSPGIRSKDVTCWIDQQGHGRCEIMCSYTRLPEMDQPTIRSVVIDNSSAANVDGRHLQMQSKPINANQSGNGSTVVDTWEIPLDVVAAKRQRGSDEFIPILVHVHWVNPMSRDSVQVLIRDLVPLSPIEELVYVETHDAKMPFEILIPVRIQVPTSTKSVDVICETEGVVATVDSDQSLIRLLVPGQPEGQYSWQLKLVFEERVIGDVQVRGNIRLSH